jgi:ABC-type glycerol-3-phosphate transport system permease component
VRLALRTAAPLAALAGDGALRRSLCALRPLVVASALIAFLAATAVARFRFPFRTTLLALLVSGLGGAVKD